MTVPTARTVEVRLSSDRTTWLVDLIGTDAQGTVFRHTEDYSDLWPACADMRAWLLHGTREQR